MVSFFVCLSMAIIFMSKLVLCVPAYIGPGTGLSAIGTLIAVIGAVLLAIIGFIWYPVKRLLAKIKKNKSGDNYE